MNILQIVVLLIINVFCIGTNAFGYSSLINLINYTPFDLLLCKIDECCSEPWIRYNFKGLSEDLSRTFHGQHLAKFQIIQSLKRFLVDKNPEKALVMSFHGITGSGKNFVANEIAKHLYKKGLKSKYVHSYIANRDFPHKEKIAEYQDRIREEVQSFSKECGHSLFIFDEVDKMPSGTIDALKPFVDHHEHIDGIDFRKNIFIFLSNAGSKAIVDLALDFWANGKEREEITMKSIEPLVSKGAFNERGGFQFSELLSSELIDLYAPFLPLEKKHVCKCIEDKLKEKNIVKDSDFIKKVADEILYFPDETELYSKSGCKRIEHKINIMVRDEDFESQFKKKNELVLNF